MIVAGVVLLVFILSTKRVADTFEDICAYLPKRRRVSALWTLTFLSLVYIIVLAGLIYLGIKHDQYSNNCKSVA